VFYSQFKKYKAAVDSAVKPEAYTDRHKTGEQLISGLNAGTQNS